MTRQGTIINTIISSTHRAGRASLRAHYRTPTWVVVRVGVGAGVRVRVSTIISSLRDDEHHQQPDPVLGREGQVVPAEQRAQVGQRRLERLLLRVLSARQVLLEAAHLVGVGVRVRGEGLGLGFGVGSGLGPGLGWGWVGVGVGVRVRVGVGVRVVLEGAHMLQAAFVTTHHSPLTTHYSLLTTHYSPPPGSPR